MPLCPHCNQERPAQGLHMHVKSCSKRPSDERLREMYVDDGMTINAIARAVGMPNGYNSVRRWLTEAGVQLRNGSSAPRPVKWESGVKALRDYAHKPKRTCPHCEHHTECHASIVAGGPVRCEGPLVAGRINELYEWVGGGWLTEEQVKECLK